MKLTALATCVAAVATATPLTPMSKGGCGLNHPVGWSNDTATNSLQMANYTRTWGVYVPDNYNSNNYKRWPLILDFHGSGGTSWTQFTNSMYYNNTLGQQYLVVYPQGFGGNWQGPNYSDPHASDLQFTTSLLQIIEATYCIDSTRVYASGKSNGAGFVNTLACSDHGDDFAAFAMASAALYTDTNGFGCTKKRAILESHGNMDLTVPYIPTHDGRGGALPTIPDWVSWWGSRTCSTWACPSLTDDLGGYNTTMYSCPGYDNVVQHYQVFNIGHCWPSVSENNNDATRNGSVQAFCLGVNDPLDFTQVVLEFFGRWNLWNAPSNNPTPRLESLSQQWQLVTDMASSLLFT